MAKVIGARRHRARLTTLRRGIRREAGKAIFVGAGILETEARRLIINDAIQGKGHVPSAPLTPPNRDTGQLDQSIVAKRRSELKSEVSANAPYAVALEHGTSKMAERPFMRPATKTMRPIITKLVRKAARRVLIKS